jgi:hypothetical protein
MGEIAWSRVGGDSETVKTVLETHTHIIAEHAGWLGDVVVPSPDGRYLAIFGDEWRTHLSVYDVRLSKWFDLGPLIVYPDSNWDYMKATWNPWFADSSHLVYFSGSNLIVSEPDGIAKKTFPIDGPAGLATPSPDGKSVAYVTFDPPTDERSSRFAVLGRNHRLGFAACRRGKALCGYGEEFSHDLRFEVAR